MKEYHKIQTVFKRDPANKHKTLLIGEYSLPEFEYLAENHWEFTEKVDGTNIRIMWDGKNSVRYGGKTDNAQLPAQLLERLHEDYNALIMSDKFGTENVCLYGEGFGPKIQKGGGNYGDRQSFVLFDVRIDDWWLKRVDVMDIAESLSTEYAPVVGTGPLSEMVIRCKDGFISHWGNFQAEGIVARPVVELKTRRGDRIITKLKCKDFSRIG